VERVGGEEGGSRSSAEGKSARKQDRMDAESTPLDIRIGVSARAGDRMEGSSVLVGRPELWRFVFD
jgi:hypothetical protein